MTTIGTGSAIGPYEITGWIGAGGMGEVYRARDARLGRDVAIKFIAGTFADDASRVQRFEQEARAAGQLNHPNILAVYDTGVHAGLPYIVCELLDGESLRERLQRGPLPRGKAVEYARQAADALAAAHDRGIVHRDVKPDNVFITSSSRVKILDFGIAKLRSADEPAGPTGLRTQTAEGTVVGTAAYMSPEQVRGEPVDARSDIFSLGVVLHEMLTGRSPFARGTAADSMAAILNDEPPELEPGMLPAGVARTIARCLEKPRESRFQSSRDLAFALDVTGVSQVHGASVISPRVQRVLPAAAALVLAAGATIAWYARPSPAGPDNPFANARFSRLTDWPGTELGAEISPDGRYVAFVADRDGEFDLWVTQVGTGEFRNLTADRPSLLVPGPILRTFGFSGDGSEIWLNEELNAAGRKVLLPITGGLPHVFLGPGDAAPAWSPDGSRLVYMNNGDGDPLFVAGRSGADPKQIAVDTRVPHSHNPVWSTDGDWIYFVHGAEPSGEMEIWRVRPDGGSRGPLAARGPALNFLAPLDRRTLLYVARDRDQPGSWLWTLDVPTGISRRVITGLDQYTHVSASRDGRRIVAASARPSATLWQVPILDGIAVDRDVTPFPVPTARALAPRFQRDTLFYLTARGTPDDGLWRVDPAAKLSQVWNGMDGGLSEPPAISRDGRRIAVVVRDGTARRVMMMDADGTRPRTVAPGIDIQGRAGSPAVDWAPDGESIVAGGVDSRGAALFLIPVNGGTPRRLIDARAASPLWSPDGALILYSGPFAAGYSDLLAIHPDGTPAEVPRLRVRPGGYRFLPDGRHLVFLQTNAWLDFRVLDLGTKETRPLTRFGNRAEIQTFDIAPDGKSIVFDRIVPNSDIVLIDLPRPGTAAPGPVR